MEEDREKRQYACMSKKAAKNVLTKVFSCADRYTPDRHSMRTGLVACYF